MVKEGEVRVGKQNLSLEERVIRLEKIVILYYETLEIENQALRDLSNEYQELRIEEMIAKKRKQMRGLGD